MDKALQTCIDVSIPVGCGSHRDIVKQSRIRFSCLHISMPYALRGPWRDAAEQVPRYAGNLVHTVATCCALCRGSWGCLRSRLGRCVRLARSVSPAWSCWAAGRCRWHPKSSSAMQRAGRNVTHSTEICWQAEFSACFPPICQPGPLHPLLCIPAMRFLCPCSVAAHRYRPHDSRP